MIDNIMPWLADTAGQTPHGFCLSWDPVLLWLHAVSDAAIGLAYMTIPLALGVFVSRRGDLVFKPLFLLFALFIVLCGIGHWISLLTLWIPLYWLEGLVKVATACVSVLTAVSLWLLLPRALLLPSPLQFRQVNEALAERRQRAQELVRLNEDLEQFAYVASHDLKAPLHAITQLAAWIGADIQDIASSATLGHVRLMQQRASRLEMLIGSLLSYARTGHDKAPVEVVKLGDLLDEITASLAPPQGFVVRYEAAMPVIRTQRPPLEHVLRNLISNAIKHHDRAQGEVVIAVRMIDGVAEFRVEDDGPGIEPRFHQRIFGIFQTLHARDERETSGVGLSIVQKAVERIGGRIWLESAPPRRGTIFWFTWPEAVSVPGGEKTAGLGGMHA
jgi:signal transduction histidine kinase